MDTLLSVIRQICSEKSGKLVPSYALDREIRERMKISQKEIDGQAAELEEVGLIRTGESLNNKWYQAVEM